MRNSAAWTEESTHNGSGENPSRQYVGQESRLADLCGGERWRLLAFHEHRDPRMMTALEPDEVAQEAPRTPASVFRSGLDLVGATPSRISSILLDGSASCSRRVHAGPADAS